MRGISNESFFKSTHPLLKFFTIFIVGDMLLLPLLIALLLITFFFHRFGLLLIGLFVLLRYLGEMFYWIMAQYGQRRYRPYDFGFKRLDNNAIYILYQLFSLSMAVVGGGIIFFALIYLK